jgi:hypothetical protein
LRNDDRVTESANQVWQFVGTIFPSIGIRQCGFALGDTLPCRKFGEFCIQWGHVALIGWYIFFCVDGIHRAFGNAHSTINAFIGINGQEVRSFSETIDRANIDTIGIFAFNAGFGDGMGHFGIYILYRLMV